MSIRKPVPDRRSRPDRAPAIECASTQPLAGPPSAGTRKVASHAPPRLADARSDAGPPAHDRRDAPVSRQVDAALDQRGGGRRPATRGSTELAEDETCRCRRCFGKYECNRARRPSRRCARAASCATAVARPAAPRWRVARRDVLGEAGQGKRMRPSGPNKRGSRGPRIQTTRPSGRFDAVTSVWVAAPRQSACSAARATRCRSSRVGRRRGQLRQIFEQRRGRGAPQMRSYAEFMYSSLRGARIDDPHQVPARGRRTCASSCYALSRPRATRHAPPCSR